MKTADLSSVPRAQHSALWRGWLYPWVTIGYVSLTCGLPSVAAVTIFRNAANFQWLTLIFLPVLWSAGFVAVAGLLSLPHQFAIRPGKFRRDVCDRIYFHRRIYGLCWTAVYYNKPVYWLCLSVPWFKWFTFRLFGYRGSMNFTVYPDTWIRDLPLLQLEDGVYVSNRATLGTNIVLSNGFLLVDRITLGEKSLVGHLTMLAPGAQLQANAEVAVGCAVGIKSKLGRGSFVGPCSVIEHGVSFGNHASVGTHSYIGSGSVVPDHFKLPPATVVSPRTRVSEKNFAPAGAGYPAASASL